MAQNNSIIGNTKIKSEYRDIRRERFRSFDDRGYINFEKQISSGSGYGQANKVWYKTGIISATESFNLFSLILNRLNTNQDISFGSPDNNSKIKSVLLVNKSSNDIGIKLPFRNYQGYNTIPASGSASFYNPNGWEIDSSGAIIEMTGNGKYEISVLGTAPPRYVSSTQIIPIEFKSSSISSSNGSINISYNSSLSNSHSSNFEFLRTAPNNASGDHRAVLEYLSTPSGEKPLRYENTELQQIYSSPPVEYFNSTQIGELIHNNKFHFAYTGDNNKPVFNASSVYAWQFIFNTGAYVQMPNLSQFGNGTMSKVEFDDLFFYADSEPSGNSFGNKEIFVGNNTEDTKILKLRREIRLRQAIKTNPGTNYTYRYTHNIQFNPEFRIGATAPRFKIYTAGGSSLVDMQFTGVESRDVEGIFTATDHSAIMSFEIPQCLPDPITWKEEWSLTDEDLRDTLSLWGITWGVTNPSIQVSS